MVPVLATLLPAMILVSALLVLRFTDATRASESRDRARRCSVCAAPARGTNTQGVPVCAQHLSVEFHNGIPF